MVYFGPLDKKCFFCVREILECPSPDVSAGELCVLKLISVAVALAVHTAVATAAPAREGNTSSPSDSLPQLGSDRGDAGTEVSASERLEAELAGLVADAGAALEEDGLTVDELLYERAQQEASSYVTGAVSSGIEGWLGSYGRAQVTLGTGYEGDLSWGNRLHAAAVPWSGQCSFVCSGQP